MFWPGGLDLVEVKQHEFEASEPCGQQQEHDCTIADRSAVAMTLRRSPSPPPSALTLAVTFEPIT